MKIKIDKRRYLRLLQIPEKTSLTVAIDFYARKLIDASELKGFC